MASSFLVAVVVILAFIYSLQLILTHARRRRLPPGPWPLPVIGSFYAVAWSRPHRSLARLAERYDGGGMMTIWAGRFPTVVVSTSDAAREVLVRRDADLAGRTVLDTWRTGGHAANSIVFLPPRGKWRALRRFATAELFAPRRLDARRPLRQEKARELVRRVSERAGRGEPVDVRDAAFDAVMDMLSRTLFSVDLDNGELRRVMEEVSVLAGRPTVSDLFPALAAADLQGARRRMAALLRGIHGMIDEKFLRRRRCREAGEPSRGDMMDVVIDREREWEEEEGSQINYDTVKTLFTDFFFAATETSSNTIEWAMAELLRCPEAMEKVREELKAVLGTRTEMEESDIAQLPYLQAVVKETLRLHPPVSLTFYRAMATVQVRGYTIPKGTNLILNIWAIQREADTWAEPDRFMPERFIGNDISFWGKHIELIPFGAGRRICPGLPLGHRTLHLVLGSLLHHFDWKLPTEVKENGVDMTEKFGLVVSMATPLKAIAKEM